MPIIINKPIGITPLELIQQYKKQNSINEKMSFAGRLDPMARGVMVLLKGQECKLQESLCGRDKIYEFELLQGFETDTLDVLGIVENYNGIFSSININDFIGSFSQKYPNYSSIVVNKKPLWWWSKNNRLNEIDIPKKEIEIYSLEEDVNIKIIGKTRLLEMVLEKIESLSNTNKDKFRFYDIKEKWIDIFENIDRDLFVIKRFRAKVSSGTYIRSLCQCMGGIAFDINRIEIL